MKVGLDAKWFFKGPPSGRRIVRGLVNGLCRRPGEHEIHLFLDEQFASDSSVIDLPPAQKHFVWAGNNQLSNLWSVARAADRLGLDAVVYQNFVPPRFPARHARIAFVHDVIFHERPEFFTRKERLYFSTVRPLSRSAERVVTVSESEKSRMARLGFARESRIDVVPYGIDNEFSGRPDGLDDDARAVASLGVHSPFILYVGRLTVRKNVSTLVRAIPHLRASNIELVVVGKSDETDVDLPTLARELSIENRIRFLGPLYDERLAALYREAAAFCFPTWDESYGLPPLEAMACGTPCIVSDLPVLREMYGDAAVHVDPRDPAAFARAIDSLLERPDHAALLRAKGIERASRFTWDGAADLLLDSASAAANALR